MKLGEKLKKNIRWIFVFFCLIGALYIAEEIFDKEILKLDIMGYQFVSTYLISDVATPIAKCITNFGGVLILMVLALILLIVIKNKKLGMSIVLNLIIIGALNCIFKYIVQRPRPTEFRMIDAQGYSFPSGHSMASTAFYGFLIYLVYKNIKNPYIKWSLMIFMSLLISLIGISRIYLGVHYTSDVLAGFLVSLSYLIIYTNIIAKYIDTE